MSREKLKRPALGNRWGGAALISAAILGCWQPAWATVPLCIFLILCLAAPFIPGLPFFLPLIARDRRTGHGLALTFDDGPDPRTTPIILSELTRFGWRATFFVTGARAQRYPELITRIIREGHTLGNHSHDHDPLLALRPDRQIRQQLTATQAALEKHGVRPLVFRPPGGIISPRLAAPLDHLGLTLVNYSCRARDGGNRRIRHLARRILDRVRPGDIVLLHDLCPAQPGDLPLFTGELRKILSGIRERELAVLPLTELIRRPVMIEPVMFETDNGLHGRRPSEHQNYQGESG